MQPPTGQVFFCVFCAPLRPLSCRARGSRAKNLLLSSSNRSRVSRRLTQAPYKATSESKLHRCNRPPVRSFFAFFVLLCGHSLVGRVGHAPRTSFFCRVIALGSRGA